MTRKDYILIAEALRKSLVNEVELHGPDSGSAGGVRLAASQIAYFLKMDNARFDSDHFLAVVRGDKALDFRPVRKQNRPFNSLFKNSPDL
jgi:hypothetical protein